MPNVITFRPRPRLTVPEPAAPTTDPGLRAHLEEAAQTALDAADKIIAALDRIEGEPIAERGISEPTFQAMAARAGQTVTLHEPISLPEPPTLAEPVEPEITSEPQEVAKAQPIIVPEPLAWYGAGNVVSFAGIALLSLIVRG